MLELINIKKDYDAAGEKVHALKGISLKFRKSEFVSILGASGCGKTTLLNIIGGLDKYTSGDLIIEGVSTKQYKDGDWDTYRNHSIGFIFQSYHLIPHQTILQNVELALTIGGVSRKERRRRAIEALEKVGLADKINAKPNQLSGGQAQRVAIARALINDPEIVLADEPTGALDSKTSVQIMELLKEISGDRLVIMVTHNPELAEQYSTRIINLFDGEVVGDSMPYDGSDIERLTPEQLKEKRKAKGKKKNSSMSIGMAMSLSMKNLRSKSKRTVLVSFAGSIGIIGVSLVLAISSGVQTYINDMENDMLSGYPLSIEQTALDYSSLTDMSGSLGDTIDISQLDDKVYVDSLMETLSSMSDMTTINNITDAYVAYVNALDESLYNAITYDYGFNIANNIYTDFYVTVDEAASKTYNQDYASGTLSITGIRQMYSSILETVEDYAAYSSLTGTMDAYYELPDNFEYIMSQYDVVAIEDGNGGVKTTNYTDEQLQEIFSAEDSLVLVIDDSALTDMTLAQLGYFSQEEFLNYAYYYIGTDGEPNEYYNEELGLVGSVTSGGIDYSYFIGDDAKTFTWYPNDSIYYSYTTSDGSTAFTYKTSVEGGTYNVVFDFNGMEIPYYMTVPEVEQSEDSVELNVKLILQKKDNISYGCLESGIYYTEALTQHVLETSAKSQIVEYISSLESQAISSVLYYYNYTHIDGLDGGEYVYTTDTDYYALVDTGNLMSTLISNAMGGSSSGSNSSLSLAYFGGDTTPSAMYIYPIDFDAKDAVTEYLDEWNTMCSNGETYTYTVDGYRYAVTLDSTYEINYTDTVGLIIGMVNTMIQMITVALICFTALSLVVSTVMIGIITYVSVVERIKEIGILRSVGARKKDIKRLFNSETFIIGLTSGVIGIILTYLISAIIDIIVGVNFGIFTIASLPWSQAGIMILISVALTLISGLIPASSAAKKDPVVALISE